MDAFEYGLFLEANKGDLYEASVVTFCRNMKRQLGLSKMTIAQDNGRSKSDPWKPDMILTLDGVRYPFEIKLDYKSQFGSSSFTHDFKVNDDFSLNIKKGETMDDDYAEIQEILRGFLNPNKEKIKDTYTKFVENAPADKRDMFSFKISDSSLPPEAFEGVAKMVGIEKFKSDLIAFNYKRKSTHYIQIGGSGYYMAENPLKLDIPKLDFDINIEIRFKDSGVNKQGLKSLSLVAIPKFGKKIQKSPLTIDDPKDFEEMFGKYK
jgi:hypothetical protein